jgi:hypothetical protein
VGWASPPTLSISALCCFVVTLLDASKSVAGGLGSFVSVTMINDSDISEKD